MFFTEWEVFLSKNAYKMKKIVFVDRLDEFKENREEIYRIIERADTFFSGFREDDLQKFLDIKDDEAFVKYVLMKVDGEYIVLPGISKTR